MENTLPTQEQLILARSKLWTPELDKLLRKWKMQIGKRERGHSNLNRKFSRRHYIFGGPAIILNSIVSVGIFATFRNCDDCDDQGAPECSADQWIRLAAGIICMISTALTAFLTFMNYADTAADHKTAADDFGSLFRKIDTLLLVPAGPVRGDPQIVLQDIRNHYDDLVRRSPTLPSKYDVGLTYEVLGKTNLPKPPTPKQYTLKTQTTSDLRKILADEEGSDSSETETNTGTTNTIKEIDDMMAHENDHQTDDENQEVTITFDLDGVQNYNATAAAFAAAELTARKEREVQDSLRAAMAFEMKRLDNHSPPKYRRDKLPQRDFRKQSKSRISPSNIKLKREIPPAKRDHSPLQEKSEGEVEIELDD